jgi:hypothetical protein
MAGVRRVRSLVCTVVSLALLAAALIAAPADAAPLPIHLGQVGSEGTTGFATSAGGCDCTAAQFEDVGPSGSSYAIPSDGVIVASALYVGNFLEVTDTSQTQTVHRTGATEGSVTSEGSVHSLAGLTLKAVHGFYERIPARAGDVLAMRLHDSGFIESTPYDFLTAATGDSLESSAPTAAGGTLATLGPATKRRLNLEAALEVDEDGDGYGDFSQDLCPGSPIAVSACTGTLAGSDLQGERSPPPPPCGGCMVVQTQLGGVSTAAPTAGVVVRWRVLNGASGPYRLRVVRFEPGSSGGGNLAYRVLRSSATETVSAPANSLFSKISTFQARLPIPAGAYVALGGSTIGFQASGGAATYVRTSEPANDGVVGSGPSANGTMLYDADVEPDADGDGYGDLTQDSCPGVATIHEGPCPSPPPGVDVGGVGTSSAPPAGAPPKGDVADKPTISGLSLQPRSFRAKPLVPASGRGAWGTKVSLSLSAKATVTLTIEAKHGGGFQTVTRLVKSLGAGKRTIAISGQYRHAGKLVDLPPGPYRLSAIARSGGVAGLVARTSFTVLPPA